MSAMLIFWVWSALMFIVRVWAKLNVKRWGSDDYAVLAAFVSVYATWTTRAGLTDGVCMQVVSIMDLGATSWALEHGYGLPMHSMAETLQAKIGGVWWLTR